MTAVVSPGRAVTDLAVRQVRRGAIIVTVLAAGMSVLVAATYAKTVSAGPGIQSLAALAANPAVRTLFGEPTALDNPGGFTVWRTGTVLAVLLGVWAVLAVTRTTRGEEDTGHWDLLLAGRVTVSGAVGRHLSVLAAVLATVGAAVATSLIAAGTDVAGAVLHGAGLAMLGIFFVGVAGLAAQIFPARGPATGAAIAVLGASLLLRMIGDGASALSWLRWLSPFGLIELTHPYQADRWLPLLVLAVATVSLLAAAPAAAGRRDVRGGWLAPNGARRARPVLLGSVAGFAARRTLRPLAGWSIGIGAYYLLIGLIMISMTDFLADNRQFADLAAQAGFALRTVKEGVATLFALLAIPVSGFVTIRIAASSADETARRLTLLYAGPVTRRRFLAAEAGAATGGAVVLAAVAGAATWAGTAISGAGLGLDAALAGTFNVLPVVALSLGAAVFALGVLPQAVAVIGTLPSVGGFLLLVLGQSTALPGWVTGLSPFAHLAPVPATGPDWTGMAGMAVVAAILASIGAVAYERRDLRG